MVVDCRLLKGGLKMDTRLSASGFSLVLLTSLILVGCKEDKKESVLQDLPYWKWKTVTNKDPMTDVESTSVFLTSGPISDGTYAPAELHFRCTQGLFEVYVGWRKYMGSGKHSVTTRVDDDQAEPNKWDASSDGRTSFYPFADSRFLDRLSKSTTYLVQVDNRGEKLRAKFNTSAMSSEVAKVRSECNI